VLRRERVAAGRRLSAFRETVSVVFASLFALSIALGLFTVIRLLTPGHTPDIGQLVRTPSDYAKQEYAYLGWWGIGVLLGACVMAYLAARPPALLTSRRDPQAIEHVSGWSKLFEENRDLQNRVLCQLDDGTTVQGWLWRYNVEPEETGDREIVLTGPLVLRHPDGHVQRTDFGGMSISARRIVYLYVEYGRCPI
jgi:Family of unknown function (DUF6338)